MTSTETIIAKRVDRVDLPDGYRLTATTELTQLVWNAAPYFSATAELENMRRHGANRVECWGCMHEEITEHFPHLAPVVLVHLADDHGQPMHAVENAMYWAGMSAWAVGKPMTPKVYDGSRLETDAEGLTWSPSHLANHLRVTEDKARELRKYVQDAGGSEREGWTFVLRELEPQWQAEADAALAVIRREA
jgi:hypothetical protein